MAAIESKFLIGNNWGAANLVEQQPVSCATSSYGYASQGCNGGYSDDAIRFASRNTLVVESAYPYSARSARCVAQKSTVKGLKLSGPAIRVAANKEALKLALLKAPVTVYFNVLSDFMMYRSGIYPGTSCPTGSTYVNHAMLLVGYNDTGLAGSSYWLVRNSWGATWGEAGYARVAMTDLGACGLYTTVWAVPAISTANV